MGKRGKLLISFISFWLFLILFKFGAGLHYALNSPLGQRVLPLWIVGMLMSGGSLLQLVLDVPAGHLLDRFGLQEDAGGRDVRRDIGRARAVLGSHGLLADTERDTCHRGMAFLRPGRNAYPCPTPANLIRLCFMAYRDIAADRHSALLVLLPFVVNASARTISMVIMSLVGLAFIAICLAPIDRKRIKLSNNPHERTHHQRAFTLRNFGKSIKRLNPASSILLMLNTAGGIFYGVIWFVVPLIIASAVYNGELLGVGLAMFDFAIVVIGAFLINMVEKTEKKLMIFAGLIVFSLAGFLLGTSFGILFLVFAFLATTGDETASLPLWAWLHKLDKKHNRDGMISGLFNLSEDLGWAVGPLFAGIFYTFLGATTTIELGAIPILAVLVIYYVFVHKNVASISVFDGPRRPHKHRHKD